LPIHFEKAHNALNSTPCGGYRQCCGTGTETSQKVGTRTIVNYGSGTVSTWYHKSYRNHTVFNCVFDILHFTFFRSHFTINSMKLIIFFLLKKLTMQKGIFSKKKFETCFLWYRYGMGTKTCQKSEPEP
jgi:hypothetical protein